MRHIVFVLLLGSRAWSQKKWSRNSTGWHPIWSCKPLDVCPDSPWWRQMGGSRKRSVEGLALSKSNQNGLSQILSRCIECTSLFAHNDLRFEEKH